MLAGIFGRRGSGKTELARQLSFAIARNGLVLVYDPVCQWPSRNRRTVRNLESADQWPPLVSFCDDNVDAVCNLALEVGNCTLIVDELDLLCSPHSWKSEAAQHVVRRGRHHRVGFIGTGQRFSNCHNDIIALAEKIVCFDTQHPGDVDRIEKTLGPEYSEAMETLGRYEFVCWPDSVAATSAIGSGKPTVRSLVT